MNKATKSLSAALHMAYLRATTGGTGTVHVFRCDMATGDQYFFWSTASDPSFVGHAEAIPKLPKAKANQIRTLKHIATVGAF